MFVLYILFAWWLGFVSLQAHWWAILLVILTLSAVMGCTVCLCSRTLNTRDLEWPLTSDPCPGVEHANRLAGLLRPFGIDLWGHQHLLNVSHASFVTRYLLCAAERLRLLPPGERLLSIQEGSCHACVVENVAANCGKGQTGIVKSGGVLSATTTQINHFCFGGTSSFSFQLKHNSLRRRTAGWWCLNWTNAVFNVSGPGAKVSDF